MKLAWIVALAFVVTLSGAYAACSPSTVKVPCRDMGDGRTLLDSAYLPDGFDMAKGKTTIIHTGPPSMKGEWGNLICTVRLG